MDNAKYKTVANAFKDKWLSRYPSPMRCIHDNGNKFLGPEFEQMLARNNIESISTTVKNPHSNAIVERLHQTLNTIISISLQENPPTSFEEVSTLIQRKCTASQFAIRATANSQHKVSPGELAYGRHMLCPFSKQIDLNQLLEQKQKLVDQANIKENSKRRFFDYKENDIVLILNKNINKGKLEPNVLPEGPWKVAQVHTNGTLSILIKKQIY